MAFRLLPRPRRGLPIGQPDPDPLGNTGLNEIVDLTPTRKGVEQGPYCKTCFFLVGGLGWGVGHRQCHDGRAKVLQPHRQREMRPGSKQLCVGEVLFRFIINQKSPKVSGMCRDNVISLMLRPDSYVACIVD